MVNKRKGWRQGNIEIKNVKVGNKVEPRWLFDNKKFREELVGFRWDKTKSPLEQLGEILRAEASNEHPVIEHVGSKPKILVLPDFQNMYGRKIAGIITTSKAKGAKKVSVGQKSYYVRPMTEKERYYYRHLIKYFVGNIPFTFSQSELWRARQGKVAPDAKEFYKRYLQLEKRQKFELDLWKEQFETEYDMMKKRKEFIENKDSQEMNPFLLKQMVLSTSADLLKVLRQKNALMTAENRIAASKYAEGIEENIYSADNKLATLLTAKINPKTNQNYTQKEALGIAEFIRASLELELGKLNKNIIPVINKRINQILGKT